MDQRTCRRRAVELLQDLGLKEYEARSFVALSRLPRGTAKEVSELSEVPRTRIYDAIRALEEKGLVEVQHSTPKVFRGVPVAEAVETIRTEYEARTRSLEETLEWLEPVEVDGELPTSHEVWALSGGTAIDVRTRRLIDDADDELVVVIGHESTLTDGLLDRLRAAILRGVSVVVGMDDDTVRARVTDELPNVEVVDSGLDWLREPGLVDGEPEIYRLLLVDRSAILVSTASSDSADERSTFGRGFDNGFVVIVRRLLATELVPSDGPKTVDHVD